MQTINKTGMPNYIVVADRTLFGSVGGINVNNSATLTQSLILNKALELPESPLMHPSIVSCGSSDVFQFFHHDSASIGNAINDSPAYLMVSCHHKQFPSARDFSQMFLGRFCAFGLKPTNQLIMLDSETFNFLAKEFVGRINSEIVNSDIDAKNLILDIRAFDIDIFGEREQKETSPFFIYPQQAFGDVPSEILFVTVRNDEGDFNSAFNCSQTQDIIFERGGTRKVISHTDLIDDWSALSSLNHSTTLLDASDGELGLQSRASKPFVNESLQFDIVLDFSLPCFINAQLQSFFINGKGFNYFRSGLNLDFCCCPDVHKGIEEQSLFKPCVEECLVSSDTISKNFGGEAPNSSLV